MVQLMIGLHIVLGSAALLGMVTAWATKKGGLWHRRGGKAYVWGMAGALAVSFVVSVLTHNIFLFLIGLFSAYLVYTGFRLALAKDSVRSAMDKAVTLFVLVTGLAMMGYAAYVYSSDSSMAIILAIFGAIAASLSFKDFLLGDKWPAGKERIVLHLNRMGAASIATVTAVFVVNVQTNPAFIAWLLPSVVGSAVITYWTRKTRAPIKKKQTKPV